ncbi:Calcium/proton exchanger [Lentinus tigrinus ALCF2SS1-7]|uniref:Calcium/proton exchanger n=1 Tax=Lentinus tigrinus ALCF2SS1-6 TaxID=1328759 RepID=A0A5C2SBN6_9APHY|nr:Calcium/proton exchanger [Lentinus tigrinus ALCF2SS1-6]RPD75162.1 Calcium/proton exchanger [Lentinus tigrinus ALCF2SS1-7]
MDEEHFAETQAVAVGKKTTFDASVTQPSRRSTINTTTNPITTVTSRSSQRSNPLILLRQLTIPEHKVGKPPSLMHGIKAIITGSWLNVLLVFIPVSWACRLALERTDKNDTLTFVFAFLAIIPLAKLLAFATDELSMRVGQTLAGLMNATLGNAVELIVAIIALVHCQITVVQSSLVGSILSNLLLVLGMCFFAGGTRFSEQGFGISVTQLNSSLLIMAVIAVLLPAAFHFAADTAIADPQESSDILALSHGAAIILLFIYGCFLVFQLFSHKDLYDDNHDRPSTINYKKKAKKAKKEKDSQGSSTAVANGEPATATTTTLSSDSTHTETALGEGDVEANAAVAHSDEEEEVEQPQMSVPLTIGLLVVVTVFVAVTAEFLVDSIDGLTDSGHISKEFVGLILLPIVGNAAEHVTAVTVSVKDKITLSLGVAVGSSIQIALFVIPFIVTLGWIIGKPMSLLFDPFESVVLFLSVIVVNYTVQDGKSNWLEGMVLMCLYVIIAVVFWYYPGVQELSTVLTC